MLMAFLFSPHHSLQTIFLQRAWLCKNVYKNIFCKFQSNHLETCVIFYFLPQELDFLIFFPRKAGFSSVEEIQ